ncbi:type II toxin-antitoxin system RelE/ParE family toxin [Pseudochelatococcus sp. B33]
MSDKQSVYSLSPLAESDLEEIWSYSFKTWSLEQANRYHADLVAAFVDLATGQRSGRSVHIRDGYFKYAAGSHFIYYRRSYPGIFIVRILHQKMDAGRYL